MTEEGDAEIFEMHRALQLEDIVDHIFGFLEVEEVKLCRLVHPSWKNVGNRVLRRKTHIVFEFKFYFDETELNRIREKMIEMSKVFILAERHPESTPFASFLFKGIISLPTFVTFMRKIGSCVKELIIYGVLKDPKNPRRKHFDLSPLLSSRLKKLHIDRQNYTSFKYHMSARSISSVDTLELGNCAIIVNDIGPRICPLKIKLLKTCLFIQNGVELKEFVVNEIFDFRRTKSMHFEMPSIILDFALCSDSKKVCYEMLLTNSQIRNWEKFNWKLDCLWLEQVPFLEKNRIDVKDVAFGETNVNLSLIQNPASVTSLALHDKAIVEWNKPFYFPNLNTLLLENASLRLLPYFSHHENLERIHLITTAFDDNQIKVKLADLPKNIKVVQLESVDVEGDESSQLPVQHLNLINYYSMDGFVQVLRKFTPDTLFIRDDAISDSDDMNDIIHFLSQPKPCQHLFIGEFNWTAKNNFLNSPFSQLVYGEAEFYYFRNNIGIPCDRDMFERCIM